MTRKFTLAGLFHVVFTLSLIIGLTLLIVENRRIRSTLGKHGITEETTTLGIDQFQISDLGSYRHGEFQLQKLTITSRRRFKICLGDRAELYAIWDNRARLFSLKLSYVLTMANPKLELKRSLETKPDKVWVFKVEHPIQLSDVAGVYDISESVPFTTSDDKQLVFKFVPMSDYVSPF